MQLLYQQPANQSTYMLFTNEAADCCTTLTLEMSVALLYTIIVRRLTYFEVI